MPADALSLSACTYPMYSGKNDLSSGRDSVPNRRYQVSAYFDQMSAHKDYLLTNNYDV